MSHPNFSNPSPAAPVPPRQTPNYTSQAASNLRYDYTTALARPSMPPRSSSLNSSSSLPRPVFTAPPPLPSTPTKSAFQPMLVPSPTRHYDSDSSNSSVEQVAYRFPPAPLSISTASTSSLKLSRRGPPPSAATTTTPYLTHQRTLSPYAPPRSDSRSSKHSMGAEISSRELGIGDSTVDDRIDWEEADDDLPPLFSTLAAMVSGGDSSRSSSPYVDSSASGQSCFCGNLAEEDSIYCSVTCGRKDALQALCAGTDNEMEEEEEDEDSTAEILKSTTSSSYSGSGRGSGSGGRLDYQRGGRSHYRRVELAEKERERQREKEREETKAEDVRRMARWTYSKQDHSRTPSSASSTGSAPQPPPKTLRRRSPPPSASSFRSMVSESSSNSHMTHSSVPSLSNSSVASYATTASSFHSHYYPPAAPCFSPSTSLEPLCAQSLPVTPQPSALGISHSDSTPKIGKSVSPFPSRYSQDDQFYYERGEDDDMEGLAYLNGSEEDASGNGGRREEELDRVETELGWIGRKLHDREALAVAQGRSPMGHERGKLSFDDVVGILN